MFERLRRSRRISSADRATTARWAIVGALGVRLAEQMAVTHQSDSSVERTQLSRFLQDGHQTINFKIREVWNTR